MSFVDAICIKILHKSLILYGRGNKLILQTGGKKHANKLSPYDKIHQIQYVKSDSDTYHVACSAGREILITEITDNAFTSSFVVKMSDWISSVKVLDDLTVVLITAHNLVALIDVKSGKAIIKQTLRCEETSTLYCSHIDGSSWNELAFFSGSALGELLVWRGSDKGSHIVHRQFLHNGVIFSIDFNGSFLITSSDDRSIKVFEVMTNDDGFKLVEKKQLFGHTSRVFVSKIINFDNEVKFLSAGEDSNLCVWSERGELLSKKNVSASGVLWNLDYSEELETVVTSSSIGKLNKFRLREILFEKHFQEDISSGENVQAVKLKYLENGSLVVIDNRMEVHVKPRHQSWCKSEQPKSLHKYLAMEVFKNRLFLAAKSSIVIFDYSESDQMLNYTTELEIREMLTTTTTIDYLRSIHPLSLNAVFVSDASGACFVIDVPIRKIVNRFQIPNSEEPWTTSVAKIEDYWLIADRVGNLFLFSNSDPSGPLQTLRKLHGKLGVTTIKVEADGFVKTTGNDGTVKTLFINRSTDSPSIEVRRCERTSINWIEKVYEWNEREYLLGFNDNYFAIHHNRQIIYEHRCGGRHRHWDVTIPDDQGRVSFTYIKKKELNFVEFTLCDHNFDADNVNWHTRDCNAIEAVHDGKLLISGGEDTLMILTSVQIVNGETTFKEVETINSHISNIKAIATFKDQEDLWIFSAGGRAQIVVTRLIKMKDAKEEINFMLTNSSQNGNAKNSTFDPETRFTSICYDAKFCNLFVACSDGFVRVFKFKKAENSFVLTLITERFYGKCILKIAILQHFVLTMATDGFICFWHLEESTQGLKLIDKLKHNQSGINCFDIYKCEDEVFVIGTSGDDAAIFITEFKFEGEKMTFQETISSDAIHIAQVTGLKFMSRNILYTTSIDQTICKLEVINKSIRVVDKKFTCISDVKGFVFLNDAHFAVFGAGLEVLLNFSE